VRRKSVVRAMVLLSAVALTAAACSSSRGGSSSPTVQAGGSGSTASSGSATKFGTIDSPCGKGNAKGATEQGVTDTAIHIGYGDDRGFSASPGLDQEMGDAIKAMVKWCNDQGGILGRQIQGDFYDAAITQVNTVMQQACKTDFMLVGEGWALDDVAEQTRLGCNLVAVPGFAVGPNFANGPEMYQAVPNPDDYLPASIYYEATQLFPDAISKFDFLHTTLSATESSTAKAAEASAAAGMKILNCGVKLNYTGEPDYKPFAQKFQSCGVKMVFGNLGPGPVLFNFLQAMDQLGVKPIYLMEANDYASSMAQWNTAGIGDNIYVREAFQPLEAASTQPAVKAYLDAVQATGGKSNQLGEQSASNFLLWATAAKSCGSTLTRQCIVDYLSKVHSWTGGGLHAPADPGANLPPKCGLLLKLTGTSWSQFFPKAAGQYDCNDKYLFKVSQANWGTTLGSDRISTKFLSASLIKPKS
jgi:ABC-type branched-subunit amino acid transport system substrate-binding protein